MSRKRIVAVVVGGLLLAVYILSVGLAWSVGYSAGNKHGWQGCIEENNLYERYYYENR